MSKELTLVEAIELAAGDCACLFTLGQLLNKLSTIPGFENPNTGSIQGTISRFLKNKKWTKVGTTDGQQLSVYCTDGNVPNIEPMPAEPSDKVITKIDPDTSVKEVMSMIEGYINDLLGDGQQLTNQLFSLKSALQDRNQEIMGLKETHAREMEEMKTRFKEAIKALK